MNSTQVIDRWLAQRVFPVVRTPDELSALDQAETLIDAGMTSVEVTLTNPEALGAIRQLRAAHPQVCIGAGTVLTAESAAMAIAAGAEFLVAPNLDIAVLEEARRHDVPAIPGVATPTELFAAKWAGADTVKVFPANTLGPSWLTALAAVEPGVRMVPTGGVTEDTLAAWLGAGAVACGLGSFLTKGTSDEIQSRVTRLLEIAENHR